MRLKVLVLAIACLYPAADAWSFEFGPRVGVSTPTGEAANLFDPGFYVGVSAASRKDMWIGSGLEFGYHYWPSQPVPVVMGLRVPDLKATSSAFHATLGVHLTPLHNSPVMPWARLGMGVYRVSTELEARGRSIGGYEFAAAVEGGLGLDLRTSATTRLGLEARLHRLNVGGDFASGRSLFSFGARLMFGEP